jgi:myo-inositol 2-dehydrogenase/D-chiro-inositol 1-dehydrogenase
MLRVKGRDVMGANKSRIALAGFGAWGQMHAQALATIEGAEIVSVYCHGGPSEAAASEYLPSARRFRDYSAMLAAGGFDVVDVTVPNFQHARFAVAALEADADVFLEKPLGLTLAECDAVIDASRRSGRHVALNHELRVSRQWGLVRDIVAKGELGRIRYQHFSLFRHAFRPGSGGWRHDPARVGSWILEELVHFFDLVMWYATENGMPTSVHTFSHGGNSGLTDNLQVILRWQDDSLAVLSQCLTGFEHHTLLEVAGDKGAIRTWWSGRARQDASSGVRTQGEACRRRAPGRRHSTIGRGVRAEGKSSSGARWISSRPIDSRARRSGRLDRHLPGRRGVGQDGRCCHAGMAGQVDAMNAGLGNAGLGNAGLGA